MKLILAFTALHDLKAMQAKYLQCTQMLLYLSINGKIARALKRNRDIQSLQQLGDSKKKKLYRYR